MTTTNFSVTHCKTLKFRDAINYVEEYFIPLTDGTHAFKLNGKWTILSQYNTQYVYLNKLPPIVTEYYVKEYDRLLIPVHDKSKPEFFDNCINFDYKQNTIKTHFKFVIDEFIDKKLDMNLKPKELFELYLNYDNIYEAPVLNRVEFANALSSVGIKSMKSGTTMYKYTNEQLFNIGLENEWYKKDPKDIEIDLLKKEIETMKKNYELLENQIENQKKEPVSDEMVNKLQKKIEKLRAKNESLKKSNEELKEEIEKMQCEEEESEEVEEEDDDECVLVGDNLLDTLC